MKLPIIIIVLICYSLHMNGQNKKNLYLAWTSNNEKIGFINLDGEAIIPIEFDNARSFSEGVVAVNKGATEKNYRTTGGKWGFMDKEGKQIIDLKYENATIFKDGLAPVKLNGKYGFINKKGKVIIDFQYDDAHPFYEELAAIKIGKKWGFINKKGKIQIAPQFGRVQDFDHGFSVVFHIVNEYLNLEDEFEYVEEEGVFGLIDPKGVLVLDTIYDYINPFKNDFARIALNGKEGFIDLTGKIVIPIQFDNTGDFSEGLAVVANWMMWKSYYDFGYSKKQIDSLEQEVNQLYNTIGLYGFEKYDYPVFREFEKAQMQKPSEKLIYGYINKKGEIVINFQFENAETFNNGLAQVRFGEQQMGFFATFDDNGKELPTYAEKIGIGYNLINTRGELQLETNQRIINTYDDLFITHNYQGIGAFNNNLIEIIAVESHYKNLMPLGNGFFYAEMKNSKQKVFINAKEIIKTDVNFNKIKAASNNRFIVDYIINKTEGKTKEGIMDSQGKWILKPTYDYIADFDKIEKSKK